MKKLFVLLISALFTSCATTKITSLKNLDIDFSDYKKILVFANLRDIDFRKTVEADLISAFSEHSTEVVSSIELFPPVKEYSDEEFQKMISVNNFDGCLSVEVINSSNEAAYISPTSFTNYQSQYVNGQLISVPYTTTYGGYSIPYLKATFEVILTDIKKGEIAFKSTAKSEADDFGNMRNISKSLAKKIVEEYVRLSKEYE